MRTDHAALSHRPLAANATYRRPPSPPRLVHINDPALDVFTDFEHVWPVTTTASEPIDAALERMKKAGVRALLVIDESDDVIGLITAQDIQGESPVVLSERTRVAHSAITVNDVMTPRASLEVLNMVSVRNAQVGNIVATLGALECRHVFVVESDPDSSTTAIRGLFSATQISRQLGVDIADIMTPAHSLLEINRERQGNGSAPLG